MRNRLERAVVDRTWELARRTRLIRLLGRIAEAAATAETVCEMLRVGVEEISAFLRWPVGHAYHLPDGWPGRLISTDNWHVSGPAAQGARIDAFRRASRDVPMKQKGLLARALTARRARWVETLTDPKSQFVRREPARRAGLESGILLPIMAEGAPVAILEFYATAPAKADAGVLSALNQVAAHIGQVAERVAARAALRQSEAMLAAVFANAADPIIVIDDKGLVRSANPAVEPVFGYAPQELIGRNISMLMPADIAQKHDGYLRDYLRTGQAKVIGIGREVTARRKSSEMFPADLTVSEIDVGGRRLFAGTLRDLTRRRAAERDLQTARQRLTDAIDGIGDGIALYDRDERLVIMNASYRRAVGFAGTAVVAGMTFGDMVRRLAAAGYYLEGTGDDVVQKRIAQFRALETVSISAQEADGPHQLMVRHYRTGDGGTLIVRSDVTEQNRAEEQAKTAQQRFADAIEGIGDGIALFDRDERLVLSNRHYTEGMAAIADKLKPGLAFDAMIRALAKENYYGPVDEAWLSERLRRFRACEDMEFSIADADGNPRWRVLRHHRTADGGTLLVRIDVTERKRIEADLDSARQNLQDAIDSVTAGMALFDADERLILCNESYRRTVPLPEDVFKPGLSFEDQIRKLMAVGRYPGKGEDWLQERLRRFRALEDTSFPALSPDGERQVEIRHYRTRDGGTFLIRTDVTDRHETEKRILALQYRLTDALDSVADGMMLFDDRERLVLANETYRRLFASIPGALEPGITFEDQRRVLMAAGRYPGRDETWVRHRIEQFRRLETSLYSVQTPDGTQHVTGRHFRTRDGGTFMIRTDITARREAEAHAVLFGGRLVDAIESVSDGIALYDAAEKLVLFNENYARSIPAVQRILTPGMAFETLVAHLAAAGGYIGAGGNWVRERIRQFRALETSEYRVDTPEGERWMVARHFRTRDGGTFLVRTDITDRIRAMQALERARTEAEAANEAKSRFLSSMSHELRTPLNAILGFGQILDMGQNRMSEGKRQEYVGIILTSGQHLLDLIDQVLELSKIENQAIEIKSRVLTPAKAMRECVDMVWEEAKRRHIEIIDATCECDEGIRFLGDPLRVRQVLINLLSNAVKYNRPGGRVTVNCDEQDGMVRLSVIDTGEGIPAHRRDEVFRPFHRLGREAGQIEGSGIGLALARELVLRMQGRIGFDSEEGRGCTFWFELPRA